MATRGKRKKHSSASLADPVEPTHEPEFSPVRPSKNQSKYVAGSSKQTVTRKKKKNKSRRISSPPRLIANDEPMNVEDITDLVQPIEPSPSLSLSDEDSLGSSVLGLGVVQTRPNYVLNRKKVRARERRHPDLATSVFQPFNDRFISAEAAVRYESLCSRRFNEMKVLPTDERNIDQAKNLLMEAGVLNTVTELDPFVEEIVKEFYANIIEKEDEESLRPRVYIRGSMYEFSPALLNDMFGLPQVPYSLNIPIIPDLKGASMGLVVSDVSDGKVSEMGRLKAKHLSLPFSVLNKICCSNYMPTMNKNTLKKQRIVLIHMISQQTPFNMGKILFDEVLACASACKKSSNTFRLVLPNLIHQALSFQRIVPTFVGDHPSVQPKPFLVDPKSTPVVESIPVDMTTAMTRYVHQISQILRAMQATLARGVCAAPIVVDTDGEQDDKDESG